MSERKNIVLASKIESVMRFINKKDLQKIMDHYSLGKVLQFFCFEQSTVRISNEIKDLRVVEIVTKTSHGFYFVLGLDADAQTKSSISINNLIHGYKTENNVKHMQLLKTNASNGLTVGIHAFDYYFYVFAT